MSAPDDASFRCRHVPLDEVYGLCFELAGTIREAGFRPDVAVAIARGGFVPARLLCDFLALEELGSLQVRHYGAGAARQEEAELVAAPNAEVAGRRVLLVDDVNDSGETLAEARRVLEAREPAALRVAVIHEKDTTRVRADFCAARVEAWHWITYQWALVEDVLGFLARMEPAPADLDEARRRLAADHGLELDPAHWRRIGSLWRP